MRLIQVFSFQSRYVKKFKLTEATFENFFCGPLPVFVRSKPKKPPKAKAKKNLIDLTGEDELIKQKKKERKEQKEAIKKKKKGEV